MSVDSINVFDRTAKVSGYAKPGATVVLQGKESVADAETGEWMGSVKNLTIGDNDFVAEQFDANGDKIEGGDIEFTVTVKTTPLTAELRSASAASSSAVIGGEATPGGVVVVDGTKEFDVDKDGEWSGTVEGLKLGANSVDLEQYVDEKHIAGDKTLDIPVTVRNLTVDHEFGSNVTDKVTLKGRAEDNAKIVITDEKNITMTIDANGAGAWSVPVNAPGAGEQDFSVIQQVNGMDSASQTETVDYGKALTVDHPENDAEAAAGDLKFDGSAQRGSQVNIYDGAGTTPVATGNPIVSGFWDATVKDVTGSEHTFHVKQTTKGNLVQTKDVTVNPGASNVTQPTAGVTFDADLSKQATIGGAGENGATITVKENGQAVGNPVSVQNGAWSLTIPSSIGAGNHTFSVVQTVGGDDAGSTSVSKDFGAAVAVTGPSTSFTGSSTNVTGTGTNGAKVQLNEGGKTIGQPVTVANGTWSIPVAEIQDGQHTYSATQTAPGSIVTRDEISATRNATRSNVTVESPKDGDHYIAADGVDFTGNGTPGGTITITPTNYAGASVTTTVKWDGSWSIHRSMGTGPYVFDVTQTAKGSNDSVRDIHLSVADGDPINLPFTLLTPASGFTPITDGSLETFSGEGRAGETVMLKPQGFGATLSTTVKNDGTWKIMRGMGTGPYVFDITQTNAGGTVTGTVKDFAYGTPTAINLPFKLLTPASGFTPITDGSLETFSGEGRAGETVMLKPQGFGATLTATVKNDGTWKIMRGMGTGPYVFDITQTNAEGTVTGTVNNFKYGA